MLIFLHAGSYHCSDLDSIDENDPPKVTASKRKAFDLISLWLKLDKRK
jgi:hypothetical protein